MPTTLTKSIGTTGRDYSTLQAFEDAIPADLTATDEVWRGECYNDSEFTAGVTFSAHVTDATRFIVLTAATGQSFQDHANVRSNALRYNQSNGVGIRITGSYTVAVNLTGAVNFITISRLQIQHTHVAAISAITVASGGNNVLVKDVLGDCTNAQVFGEIFGTSAKFVNTVAVQRSTTGHGFTLRQNVNCIGCTAVVPSDVTNTGGVGFRALNYSAPLLKSCTSFGFSAAVGTVGVGAFSGSSSHNATNHASGLPGSNNQHSVTFNQTTPFTDADKDSLDLRSIASTSLAGNGLLDSTNAPNDISGTARSGAPTIGHWELVVALTIAIPAGGFAFSGNNPTIGLTGPAANDAKIVIRNAHL